MESAKPTLEEVSRYARPIIRKFIGELAGDSPFEHREEMEQEALLLMLEIYDDIDPNAGWRSYVYLRAQGAVKDYLKRGSGFAESRWSLHKKDDDEKTKKKIQSRSPDKINQRVFLTSNEGEDLDLDHILGANGVFSDADSGSKIRWDLVARMARRDKELHAFAKWIRGFSIEEMIPVLGLSRARIGQFLATFILRFRLAGVAIQDLPVLTEGQNADELEEVLGVVKSVRSVALLDDVEGSPGKLFYDAWFRQTCYAFGLCDQAGIRDEDQSSQFGFVIGWNLDPVDLDAIQAETPLDGPVEPPATAQMDLFGNGQEQV